MERTKNKAFWLFPIIGGILLFIVFFVLAAFHYPGGSNFNTASLGYSWKLNFWCELLGEHAKNGEINHARPFAFTGMISLSFGVSAFWYTIPKNISKKGWIVISTSLAGILSMLFSSFIYTSFHDSLIYAAVICGSVSFSLLFYSLYKGGKKFFLLTGGICLLLVFINCFIYISNSGIQFLPSIQKVTFILILSWISMLSVSILKLSND